MADRHVFETMNALRGVAATLVLINHLFGIPVGNLAVDFFFVLSGFVVAYSYEERLLSGMAFSEFAYVRFVRLYPLYFLSLALAMVVVGISALNHGKIIDSNWPVIAGLPFAILALPYFSTHMTGWLYPTNAPAWSLMFEVIANFVYAWMVTRLTDRNLRLWLVIAAIALVARGLTKGYLAGSAWEDVLDGFVRVGFSFPAGVLLYRYWRAGFRLPRISPILLAVALVASIAASSTIERALLCTTIVFPAIMMLAANSEPGLGTRKLFSMIGDASYAIYILHPPFLLFFNAALIKLSIAPTFFKSVAFMIALFVACVLVDAIYDRPIRSYLKRFTPRRAAQSSV